MTSSGVRSVPRGDDGIVRWEGGRRTINCPEKRRRLLLDRRQGSIQAAAIVWSVRYLPTLVNTVFFIEV